jgi:hypothetical protein
MTKHIIVPRGTLILLGVSYLLLLALAVGSMTWDIFHPDPTHVQFPVIFRVMLTVPAFTLTILGIIYLMLEFHDHAASVEK